MGITIRLLMCVLKKASTLGNNKNGLCDFRQNTGAFAGIIFGGTASAYCAYIYIYIFMNTSMVIYLYIYLEFNLNLN